MKIKIMSLEKRSKVLNTINFLISLEKRKTGKKLFVRVNLETIFSLFRNTFLNIPQSEKDKYVFNNDIVYKIRNFLILNMFVKLLNFKTFIYFSE